MADRLENVVGSNYDSLALINEYPHDLPTVPTLHTPQRTRSHLFRCHTVFNVYPWIPQLLIGQ
jgi:hypothetical protein